MLLKLGKLWQTVTVKYICALETGVETLLTLTPSKTLQLSTSFVCFRSFLFLRRKDVQVNAQVVFLKTPRG